MDLVELYTSACGTTLDSEDAYMNIEKSSLDIWWN